MEGVELRDFALEHPSRPFAAHNDTPDKLLQQRRQQGGPLRRFWRTYIRVTINEAASRDHLALERTFLAYVRTASAYAQFGVTIAQLFRLNTTSAASDVVTPTSLRIGKALGAATECIAIGVMLLGAAYFVKQQSGLLQGTSMSRGYEVVTMFVLSFVVS